MAQSGPELGDRACLLCPSFQTSIRSATASAPSTSIPRQRTGALKGRNKLGRLEVEMAILVSLPRWAPVGG
jgi:hypothetical protein